MRTFLVTIAPLWQAVRCLFGFHGFPEWRTDAQNVRQCRGCGHREIRGR